MASKKTAVPKLNAEVQRRLSTALTEFISNETILRREAIEKLLNPGKDIDFECGYPDSISDAEYRRMYRREGIGRRVVRMMPEECWKSPPAIYENNDPAETAFEQAWDAIQTNHKLLQYMQRADILSGIGSFGLIIFGLPDGKKLNQPVDGIDLRTGEAIGNRTKAERDLLYIKTLDSSVVEISQREMNETHPRFGLPIMYGIQFDTGGNTQRTTHVHWTRVIHIADNRESSEVMGTPRQEPVWNRLLDIRKTLAGSAEMFWKGGYPGLAATFDPKVVTPDMIQDQQFLTAIQQQMKTEIDKWHNSLQRVLALVGMDIKSLAPQVADPSPHLEGQLKAVALSLGIPYRVFVGTEEAKLASTQDAGSWNSRVSNRQEYYLTPMLIRPTIDRLITYGVLPQAEYIVDWPDLNAKSEKEQAEVAQLTTESLAKYVAGDVASIMEPFSFLTMVLHLTDEEADAVIKAAEEYEDENIPEEPAPPQPVDEDAVPEDIVAA